jgi:AcrR family transcriptional regulator
LPSRAPVRRLPRRREPSRDRLFAAAAAEFAARGFAGASVDRIARAARLNKAMLYYHFASKAGLYREILSDMFGAVAARVQAAVDSDLRPDEKLRRFVEAIALEAEARPHFPPIWFREIAEGGAHLDAAVLRTIASVVQALAGIVGEGTRAGRFVAVNPMLVHASIVGPLLLFFASHGVRQQVGKIGLPAAAEIDRDVVVEHVHRVALAMLEGRA